jgi:hypothetical protein
MRLLATFFLQTIPFTTKLETKKFSNKTKFSGGAQKQTMGKDIKTYRLQLERKVSSTESSTSGNLNY